MSLFGKKEPAPANVGSVHGPANPAIQPGPKDFDQAVEALRVRADAAVEATRQQLLSDARALVEALEGRSEILRRFAGTNDLMAAAAYFVAKPIVLPMDQESPAFPSSVNFGYSRTIELPSILKPWTDDPMKLLRGEYTLVVALVRSES